MAIVLRQNYEWMGVVGFDTFIALDITQAEFEKQLERYYVCHQIKLERHKMAENDLEMYELEKQRVVMTQQQYDDYLSRSVQFEIADFTLLDNVVFDNFDDYKNSFTIKDISQEMFLEMKNVFSCYHHGIDGHSGYGCGGILMCCNYIIDFKVV